MQVDFYVLQSQHSNQRDVFVCQLIEKVWKKGHTIYLHTDSPNDAQRLDNLLWTFRQGSFIPHELSNQTATEAVMIGCEAWQSSDADILLNIATTLPTDVNAFQRILEVLNADPQIRQAGREHYRTYQQQDFELNSHIIQR